MDKTTLFKKDAKWHHEIVHFPAIQVEGRVKWVDKVENFCSYTRWFLVKLFVVIPAVTIAIGGFLGQWIAGFLAFLSPSIPLHIIEGWLFFNLLLFMFVGGLSVLIWLDLRSMKKRAARRQLEIAYELGLQERPAEKPEGFLTVWYRSFKGKFCPQMDY